MSNDERKYYVGVKIDGKLMKVKNPIPTETASRNGDGRTVDLMAETEEVELMETTEMTETRQEMLTKEQAEEVAFLLGWDGTKYTVCSV